MAVSLGNQPLIDTLTSALFDSKTLAQRQACRMFRAFVVVFHDNDEQCNTIEVSTSVSDLLSIGKSTTGDHLWTHRFTTGGLKASRYRWLHLPVNNFEWVEEAATKACLDSGSTEFEEFRSVLSTLSRQQRSAMRHSKHMKSAFEISINQSQDSKSRPFGALYVPYLSFLTIAWHCKMIEAIFRSTNHPEDFTLLKEESLAKLEVVLKGYSIRGDKLHLPSTLDQYRHPAMHTRRKDADQVVDRYQQAHLREYPKPRLYIGSQLWIWILQEIIITSFPDLDGEELVFDHVLQHIRVGKKPTKQPQDLLVAVLDRFLGTFDRFYPSKSRERLFGMFECAVADLNVASDDLLDEFQEDGKMISGCIANGIKDKEHRPSTPQFVNRLIDISNETRYYFECVDMIEELTSLSIVLEEQQRMINLLIERMKPIECTTRKTVGKQKVRIRRDIAEIERLKEQVVDIKSILDQLLHLKPRHATAIEARSARSARDQAEDTARSGQIIMVFTIVLIVFLPLSFMAAFFAINIDFFPQNAESRLSLDWVSKYLFSISMAILIPIIMFA